MEKLYKLHQDFYIIMPEINKKNDVNKYGLFYVISPHELIHCVSLELNELNDFLDAIKSIARQAKLQGYSIPKDFQKNNVLKLTSNFFVYSVALQDEGMSEFYKLIHQKNGHCPTEIILSDQALQKIIRLTNNMTAEDPNDRPKTFEGVLKTIKKISNQSNKTDAKCSQLPPKSSICNDVLFPHANNGHTSTIDSANTNHNTQEKPSNTLGHNNK
jgi:hypothetical protein